MIEEGG